MRTALERMKKVPKKKKRGGGGRRQEKREKRKKHAENFEWVPLKRSNFQSVPCMIVPKL